MDILNPLPEQTYGQYLRALREARSMDTTAFAAALYRDDGKAPKPMSQLSNIHNWERDKTRPRKNLLPRLAKVLGVSQRSINPVHYSPARMQRQAIVAHQQNNIIETEVIPMDQPLDLFPEVDESYGHFLGRLRSARGFASQMALSREMWGEDVTPGQATGLSKWERNANLPMLGNVGALAKALNVPLALVDPEMFKRLRDEGDAAIETYGDYLRRLRMTAGYLEFEQLAKALFPERTSFSTAIALIGRWERNAALPSGPNVDRLAKLYGVSYRTLDPHRYTPGRLLPPTLKLVTPEPEPVAAPPAPPAPEPESDIEKIGSDDVQWDEASRADEASAPPAAIDPAMPQFLKQHVDIFGLSKTDDPAYVRIRFDAVLPRKTAGALMRELVILTTDDLLSNAE